MPVDMDQMFYLSTELLAELAENQYRQHRLGLGGAWSLPPLNGSWDGDLFDFQSMGEGFDRNGLSEQYVNTINNATIDDGDYESPSQERGTLADIASIKIQAGWLEQREQAFRARHTTPVMATCYAAARKKGHGMRDSNAVGVFGNLADYVVNIINHGR